jgi:hypothetical protein
MTDADDEVIMLASGDMPQVELWRAALADEGIDARAVGEELTVGLGTAFPVELWVRAGDAERAAAVIRGQAAADK